MKEEILSIASDLREGFINTNEAIEQLLVLLGDKEVSGDCGCPKEVCKMIKGKCKNLAYR
jgi:hypothetical protein